MKQKDITEKILIAFPEVFADVINGSLFQGRQVVKSDELTDALPSSSFKDDAGIHHEQIRDVAKLWKKRGMIFSFIGIENQTQPDKDMILRVLSYDGATYKSQLGNQRIYPSLTIVLYWGEAEWKAGCSLRERLTIPEEFEEVISDYSFRLIDLGRLEIGAHKNFRSDFKHIVQFLIEKEEYEPSKEEIKHPSEVLDLLRAITKDERFYAIKDKIRMETKEGGTNMCELLDKIENRGLMKGLSQGREEGREEGKELATLLIARNLKENQAELSLIVKVTGLSEDEVKKL